MTAPSIRLQIKSAVLLFNGHSAVPLSHKWVPLTFNPKSHLTQTPLISIWGLNPVILFCVLYQPCREALKKQVDSDETPGIYMQKFTIPKARNISFRHDSFLFWGGFARVCTFHAEWLSGRLSWIPLSLCFQAFLFRKLFLNPFQVFLLTVRVKVSCISLSSSTHHLSWLDLFFKSLVMIHLALDSSLFDT